MKGEKLQNRDGETAPAAQSMAVRAVALCEGCPMVQFCVVKGTDDCPPQTARSMNEGNAGIETPIRPRSYLTDLLDDTKPVVMATPTRKPLPALAPVQPPQAEKLAAPVQVSPSRSKPLRVARRQVSSRESGAGMVADILYEAISITSPKNARVKK